MFVGRSLTHIFAMPDHLRLVCSSLGSWFQRSAVRTRRSEGIAENLQSASFTEGSRPGITFDNSRANAVQTDERKC